jgi:hypothetical protein
MPSLRMKDAGGLWDRSTTPPTEIDFINSSIVLDEVGRTDDGNWVRVVAHYPDGTTKECYARAVEVAPAEESPAPIDLAAFVKYCALQARVTNLAQGAAQYGVSSDYLLALAWILSGVKNVPADLPPKDAFGPYRFTVDEWQAATQLFEGAAYQPADRFDPLAQVEVMARKAFEDTRKISMAFTDSRSGSGPYIPNSMELFLVCMLPEPQRR